MDALTLARLQFATTIVYHYFFVPLTLGLVLLIAIMETLYVRSDNTIYKRMAQFWGKLFLINFALGVVTGIVQEFQFGMNWSAYSRFIGDVVGAPLAIETLLAFFLESTFLGIWIFGWERLSKKVHLATIWLVAFGSYLSTYWILVANSFMQQPVGFTVHNGRAEMTDFLAIITNSNLWFQFPHVLAGGIVTGAFFVIGISAYHFLRKTKEQDFFQRSMHIGLVVALISSIVASLAGHLYGQHDLQTQPMKMAAAEALWNSQQPAALSLITISDEQNRKEVFSLKIPNMLSFLSYNNFSSEVEGINQIQARYEKQYGPGNYIPSVTLSFISFRLMMATGGLMVVVSAMGLFLFHKRTLFKNRFLLWIMVASLFTPYIANTFGWLLGEMGRQPWTVFGLLTTASSVSPTVSAGEILFSLLVFVILYLVLGGVDGFLLFKYAKKGVQSDEVHEESKEEQFVVTY